MDLRMMSAGLLFVAMAIFAWITADRFALSQAGSDRNNPSELKRWSRRSKIASFFIFAMGAFVVCWTFRGVVTITHA